MTAHSTALGIASLGRHGDDMIVHMNRDEVQGLQALAQTHGASLSINPHTGMPEAFSLGGVFKALLPVAAGFALGPGGFDLFSDPLMAGLAVGAGTGLLTGNIGQGLMAGMGAYGGFGLSDVWSKMGGLNALKAGQDTAALNSQLLGGQGIKTVANPIADVVKAAPGETLSSSALEQNINNLGSAIPKTQTVGGGLGTVGGQGIDFGANLAKNVVGQSNIPLSLSDTAAGAAQPSLYSKFIAAGGTPAQLATTIGGGLLGGVQASDFAPKPVDYSASLPKKRIQTGTDASGNPTYTYVPITAYDPRETLNLNDPYANYGNVTPPPTLKLPPTMIAKEGGEVKSYAIGGTVTTGGLRDLYSATDNISNPQLSRDGYGIGRLNSLAQQQSMNQAETMGYAMGGLTALKSGGPSGGYLDGEGDGMSDSIPATIEGKQPARLADGEFVIPADVVSHLGNGSSKAGSKRLYAMMQKVRKARTGNPKQGKQIKPEHYMPA